jgi:hypothetical protein
MKMITLLKITIISVGIVLTNTANAAFPIGLWQVSHYDFVNKVKINSGSGLSMCILSNGTIKGLATESAWNGNWKKSGDLVLIRMTDGGMVGSWVVTQNNPKLMTGYNQSWSGVSDTSNGLYTTSVWEFKNTVCP